MYVRTAVKTSRKMDKINVKKTSLSRACGAVHEKLGHEEELSNGPLRTENWVLPVCSVTPLQAAAPGRRRGGIRKQRARKQTGRVLTATPLWAHTTRG